ncbi:unnamed protein product, partial [Mesorhabditis spiculigera]
MADDQPAASTATEPAHDPLSWRAKCSQQYRESMIQWVWKVLHPNVQQHLKMVTDPQLVSDRNKLQEYEIRLFDDSASLADYRAALKRYRDIYKPGTKQTAGRRAANEPRAQAAKTQSTAVPRKRETPVEAAVQAVPAKMNYGPPSFDGQYSRRASQDIPPGYDDQPAHRNLMYANHMQMQMQIDHAPPGYAPQPQAVQHADDGDVQADQEVLSFTTPQYARPPQAIQYSPRVPGDQRRGAEDREAPKMIIWVEKLKEKLRKQNLKLLKLPGPFQIGLEHYQTNLKLIKLSRPSRRPFFRPPGYHWHPAAQEMHVGVPGYDPRRHRQVQQQPMLMSPRFSGQMVMQVSPAAPQEVHYYDVARQQPVQHRRRSSPPPPPHRVVQSTMEQRREVSSISPLASAYKDWFRLDMTATSYTTMVTFIAKSIYEMVTCVEESDAKTGRRCMTLGLKVEERAYDMAESTMDYLDITTGWLNVIKEWICVGKKVTADDLKEIESEVWKRMEFEENEGDEQEEEDEDELLAEQLERRLQEGDDQQDGEEEDEEELEEHEAVDEQEGAEAEEGEEDEEQEADEQEEEEDEDEDEQDEEEDEEDEGFDDEEAEEVTEEELAAELAEVEVREREELERLQAAAADKAEQADKARTAACKMNKVEQVVLKLRAGTQKPDTPEPVKPTKPFKGGQVEKLKLAKLPAERRKQGEREEREAPSEVPAKKPKGAIGALIGSVIKLAKAAKAKESELPEEVPEGQQLDEVGSEEMEPATTAPKRRGRPPRKAAESAEDTEPVSEEHDEDAGQAGEGEHAEGAEQPGPSSAAAQQHEEDDEDEEDDDDPLDLDEQCMARVMAKYPGRTRKQVVTALKALRAKSRAAANAAWRPPNVTREQMIQHKYVIEEAKLAWAEEEAIYRTADTLEQYKEMVQPRMDALAARGP